MDDGSSKTVVIHETAACGRTGNTTHGETLAAVLQHWIRLGVQCSFARMPSQIVAPTYFRTRRLTASSGTHHPPEDHNDMSTHSGGSADAAILGRVQGPLDSSLEGRPVQMYQETIRGSPA